MRFMFRIVVSLLFTFPALVHVQEVNTLTSLSSERQTELRHPPAPPLEYKDGKCIGGGIDRGSVAEGAPDQREPHALRAYLLYVTPTEIHRAELFEAEFKVLNTGREVDLDARRTAL